VRMRTLSAIVFFWILFLGQGSATASTISHRFLARQTGSDDLSHDDVLVAGPGATSSIQAEKSTEDDLSNSVRTQQIQLRLRLHRYILLASLTLFLFFHSALFAFLPQRKENLFFCITLVLSLITLIILDFSEEVTNPKIGHALYWLFLGMMPVCLLSGLVLSHFLWSRYLTRRTLFTWSIIFAVVYGIGWMQDNRFWPYATVPLATLAYLRLAFSKNSDKRSRPRFLQVGVLLFAAAVTFEVIGDINVVLLPILEPVSYLWAYGFIAMLACVSLEIGREFAHATRELEDLTATLEVRVEQYAKELEQKSLAQARLETLRYQLNPHFLYNALNSVDALSRKEPEDVPLLIQRLCEYLRYSLDVSDDGTVTLQKELDALHSYLEIEKTRYEDQLDIVINVAPEAASQIIPELLLLPLVENAVKHGMKTSKLPLRIRVIARCEARTLCIEVKNTGRISSDDRNVFERGIGLSNTRSRLELLYGERQHLQIRDKEGWVVVRIEIPLQKSH
jgi:hypothetical protein